MVLHPRSQVAKTLMPLHPVGAGQPQQDHPRHAPLQTEDQLPEVLVLGYKDPLLIDSQLKDLAIGNATTALGNVADVHTIQSPGLYQRRVNVFIGQ